MGRWHGWPIGKFGIDDGHGTLLAPETLEESFQDTKMLPEVSPILWIEATIVTIRLQSRKRTDKRLWVCHCHPNGIHPTNQLSTTDSDNCYGWHSHAVLDEEAVQGQFFNEELLVKPCDGMALGTSIESSMVILLKWRGDIAYRFGTVDLPYWTIWELPKISRRIRLG